MAIVVGSCTAGAAYVPAMVQEAVIVKKIGTIFLAGPPLVKAALGELVSPENLGGADVHCRLSGLTDHYAETEEEAFETGRDIVASFNVDPVVLPEQYDEPAFDPTELLGLIPPKDQHLMDMYQVNESCSV
jgi:3-methylcrotonyl-CoA carboxylase beta subunit